MRNDRLHMIMLLDFYGELLAGKQREYLSLYHNEDLSLTEIAERAGISKQGVHDTIVRAEKALTKIEQKTGLMQKWGEARERLEQAVENGAQMHPVVAEYFNMGNAEKIESMESTGIGV